jgi:hypothetical protein
VPNVDVFQLSRESIVEWLDCLVSCNHPSSELLWKEISDVVDGIFGIDCKNRVESTLPGYLLDFSMLKLGIEINYRVSPSPPR